MSNLRHALILAVLAATRQAVAQPVAAGEETLLSRLNWARLGIVRGHVVPVGGCHGPKTRTTNENPSRGLKESLTLHIDRGQLSIRFSRQAPTEQLEVELGPGRRALITCVQAAGGGDAQGQQTIRYEQRAGAAPGVFLSVRIGEESRQAHGACLWRLYFADPALCRRYLAPLLNRLESDLCIDQRAEEIALNLARQAGSAKALDAERLRDLVRALSSARFADRRAAERRLSQLSVRQRSHVERLATAECCPEQEYRLGRLLSPSQPTEVETPETTALRLLDDANVWRSLQSHEDRSVRLAAATQLERLTGGGAKAEGKRPAAGDIRLAQPPGREGRRSRR